MVYPTKLNTLCKFGHMKSIILIVFFALLLFPISSSFSQKTDQPSQFGYQFTSTSPFIFKDENGYTIILGEIENIQSYSLKNVKIRGVFYDGSMQILDTSFGSSIIEVIPPFTKVPYIIKSTEPNAGITQAEVKYAGFNSAPTKNEELVIDSEITEIGDKIRISGTITNQGLLDSNQTKIYLAFYQYFTPEPRILGISTIELEDIIVGGSSTNFEFEEIIDYKYTDYKIFAESENYNSNIQTNKIILPEALTKLVTINDISITDDEGNKLSDVKVGTRINIESKIWIQYSEDQETSEQPYRYYVQVKQSGEKAFVEFIGIYEGSFSSAGAKFPEVKWTPKNTGLYFAETFVWDTNAVPLASKGPVILILVT